jgi:hypothetical protein
MIKIVRSMQPRMGKSSEAVQHARAVADYVNRKFPSMHLEVFMAESGTFGTIYWLGESESLATLEQEDAALAADPGWAALWKEAEGLYLDGSLHNLTLRSF